MEQSTSVFVYGGVVETGAAISTFRHTEENVYVAGMAIHYCTDAEVSVEQFAEVLRRSTLAERRPIDDRDCLRGMLEHADLLVSAWEGTQLIGIARSVTDFHYCCYLSDLAVDRRYQREGIGLRLQQVTQEALGPRCQLILLAAPDANSYYPAIGYESNPRCWVLPRNKQCGRRDS